MSQNTTVKPGNAVCIPSSPLYVKIFMLILSPYHPCSHETFSKKREVSKEEVSAYRVMYKVLRLVLLGRNPCRDLWGATHGG